MNKYNNIWGAQLHNFFPEITSSILCKQHFLLLLCLYSIFCVVKRHVALLKQHFDNKTVFFLFSKKIEPPVLLKLLLLVNFRKCWNTPRYSYLPTTVRNPKVIKPYTFHYLFKLVPISRNQNFFEIFSSSDTWHYQGLITLSSVVS